MRFTLLVAAIGAISTVDAHRKEDCSSGTCHQVHTHRPGHTHIPEANEIVVNKQKPTPPPAQPKQTEKAPQKPPQKTPEKPEQKKPEQPKKGGHKKPKKSATPNADKPEANFLKKRINSTRKEYKENPARPHSKNLQTERFTGKTTHQRILEKTINRKIGYTNQHVETIHATNKRPTFRGSELVRREEGVVGKCEGYNNIRERDACLKRAGVHTNDTKCHFQKQLNNSSENCYKIKNASRRRNCFNSYLRNGECPYFAEQNGEQEEQEDVIDEDNDEDMEEVDDDEFNDDDALVMNNAGETSSSSDSSDASESSSS